MLVKCADFDCLRSCHGHFLIAHVLSAPSDSTIIVPGWMVQMFKQYLSIMLSMHTVIVVPEWMVQMFKQYLFVMFSMHAAKDTKKDDEEVLWLLGVGCHIAC